MATEETQAQSITVEVNGEEHEVPAPKGWVSEEVLREGYVPKSTHHAAVRNEVKEATKGLVNRDDLFEDDEFVKQVAERRKDDLISMLGVNTAPAGKPDEDRVQRIAQQIEEQKVTPLRKELEGALGEVEKWRNRGFEADIAEAFSEFGVETEDGMVGPRKKYLRDLAAFDEELGAWVVKAEDGTPDFVVGEDGKPRPKTIVDVVRDMRKSGKYPGWFRGETRSGVGFKGSGAPGGGQKKRGEMSAAEKAEYIGEHGTAAFLDLPA